ncbi:MAG: VOC family protein [Bacteroidota bacterium]|nr:VOC family protein [Bacteroidota bacterium]
MKEKISFPLNKLQHIGIPVTDLVRSTAFYEKLGFDRVMQAPFTIEGQDGICTMMENNGITVELYQLPEHLLLEISKRDHGHVDHIAFDVPDIEHAYRELKNGGFSILEEAPVHLDFWGKGCRYFNVIGPDGERLEFNQIL